LPISVEDKTIIQKQQEERYEECPCVVVVLVVSVVVDSADVVDFVVGDIACCC
jgi:hypothetical protein